MSVTWYIEALDHNYTKTGVVWDYFNFRWADKETHPGFLMFEGAVAVAEECGFEIGREVKITEKDLKRS